MDALAFDDPEVYALLRQGRTAGVFQFESPLATDTLRAMKCDRFDDLVASNALLRPGPLDAGMHMVFIRRKLGQEKVSYPHPSLREVLEPTYGVITYQEQVMRIANVLAGFSLAEADVLRKAVGKKDAELIKQELGKFCERAMALGHPKKLVDELAAQIETFGRYGFNKSHSVAYSVLSYQTAWLKAHYPAEFMAALLSSEIGNTDKVVQYINEARELGLEVLPPDVNESGFKFTVVGDRRIRFGLGAVRNVGGGAIESIIAAPQRDARHRRSRTSSSGSTSGSATSGCSSRWSRRAPATRWAATGRSSSRRWSRPWRRRSSCSRSGRRARRRCSASRSRAAGASAPGRAARHPALDRGRAAGEGEGGPRLLHLRPPAGALPRRGRAVRHPHHRHARRVERAPGQLGAVVTAVKRQISKKTGQGVRPAGAGGLPRHGGGDRLPRCLGQAQPDDRGRRGAAAHRRLQRPGPGRGPRAVHRRVGAPLDDLKTAGAVALSLRWRAPDGPAAGGAPGGRGALFRAPGSHAALY